jgi:KDO2-lipid IV(A) lauroyltransferase
MGFARALPSRAGYRVFGVVGSTAGLLLKRDRERAIDNLAIAFPHMPREMRGALVKAMFRSLGQNAFEFLNLAGSSKEHVTGLVERVEGQEHIDRAVSAGRGVLAVTGHIGCWELMGAYFANQGYPINAVGRELWEKRIHRELIRMRESVGFRTIDRDSGGREMLRILRAGGIIAVLIDQHTRVSGMYVPFFNRPAHTPTGVAKLAITTGAMILPLAIFMTQPGKHLIRALEPIDPKGIGDDRDAAVEEITRRSSLAIEDLIRYDPKQWVWFHKRWREPERTEMEYATVN